ncbi:MAG: TetR family transcriptional regulator [Actinomycetota bacterium]
MTAAPLDDLVVERRGQIHEAAIDQFVRRGITGTSMANIADAAGLSRPALYQYFDNKTDIFASAFVALFEKHIDLALDALDQPAATSVRLDGFLQRFEGDLWQLRAGSPHADEILRAKHTHLATSIEDVVARLWAGLDSFLAAVAPGRSKAAVDRRTSWFDVLRFAPRGLAFDQPPVDVYRRRLATLASSVAADIDSL